MRDAFDRLSRGLAAGFGPDESSVPPATGDGTLPLRPAADAFGKYEVQDEVARGGVGVIYRAHDRDLGRDVAVKLLRDRYRNNAALVQRFIEEAQIGGQLEHPGIVPVYELGQASEGPFFAMKLVHGQTLAELLEQRKGRTEGEQQRFLAIFEKVCQTMAYSHARGVIHRDLKPANIMVGEFGEVQVMDWGMGKVLSGDKPASEGDTDIILTIRSLKQSDDVAHSIVGSVMGTPAYMPPEQARGDVASMTHASDVFALGAILCELLTGSPPYRGARHELFVAAKDCDLADAEQRLLAPGVDPTLAELARDCLREHIHERPANAAAVAQRIGEHFASVEHRAEQARIIAAAERAEATAARKAQRLTTLLAVVVVAFVAAGALVWLIHERTQQRQAAAENRSLESTLQEARMQLQEAKAQTGPDKGAWSAALLTGNRLRQLMDSDRIEADLRQRASALLQDLQQAKAKAQSEAETRQRDVTMLRRLDAIRMPEDHGYRDKAFLTREATNRIKAYEQAFRDYGIDPLVANEDESVQKVASSRIGEALATAAEHWAGDSRTLGQPADVATRLLRIAMRADADPWRQKMRQLRVQTETPVDEIRALAASANPYQMSATSLLAFAGALHRIGDEKESIELLRQGRMAHPKDYYLHLILGLAHENQDPPQWDQAARVYSAALALRPDNSHMAHRLGTALCNIGQIDEAAIVLREVLRREPDFARSAILLCEIERRRGRFAAAVEVGRRAVQLAPDNAMAHSNLAVALIDTGEIDQAEAATRVALERNPRLATAHCVQSWIHYQRNQDHEAAQCARRAIEARPRYPQAHHNLGAALQRLGELQEAHEAFARAAEYAPSAARHRSAMAGVAMMMKKPGLALTSARWAALLDPSNAEIQLLLGLLAFQAGAHDEGIEALLARSRLLPADADCHHRLGCMYLKTNQPELAVRSFERAVELDASRRESFGLLGRALRQLGRNAEASRAEGRSRKAR